MCNNFRKLTELIDIYIQLPNHLKILFTSLHRNEYDPARSLKSTTSVNKSPLYTKYMIVFA